MNPYAIPVLIGAIFSITAGGLIYSLNKRSQVNIGLSIFCLSMFIWLFGDFIAYSANNERSAFLFCRVACIGAMFTAPAFYHFTAAFLQKNSEVKYVVISYVIMFSIAPLSLISNWFLSGVYHYFWGYYSKAGYLHPLYLAIFFAIFVRGFYLLLLERRKKDLLPKKRIQIDYVFIAYIIALIASLDYVPKYGVEMYPFGFTFSMLFVIIVAYAVIRHQLLGIEVIIKKTVIFAGVFVAFFTVFAGITFIVSQLFGNLLSNRWLALVPSFIVIILAYRPLKNLLINITEKYLFQKKYDYKDLLKIFMDEVMTVLDLNVLGDLAVSKLTDIIKLQGAMVLLKDEDTDNFHLAASAGVFPKSSFKPTGGESLLENTKKYGYYTCTSKGTEKLVIPLQHGETVLGMIILGAKKSDEEFTQDDIGILLPLARALSIAITNARLVTKLSITQAQAAQREKMAIIGTLSAGINHEICHPLGTIRGECQLFVLNSEDGIHEKQDPKEVNKEAKIIMEKVIKEADRATEITKRLLAFSKPAKNEMEDNVSIKEELEEIIAIIGHELTLSDIEIHLDIPEDIPPIIADKKQVQEILFNLIQNAAQAIGDNGRIAIKAAKEGTEVHIDIKDTGVGIPKEQIEQIWNPFFTTKGSEKGTGLGLFIVKQIVERNHGQISVTSEPGKGTNFSLIFRAGG